MDLELTGKVAIVTGGGEGIGYAAAERIAIEGGNVILVGRRAEVLEAAASRIRSVAKSTILPVSGDVSKAETVTRVVEAAVSHFGRIDILINNAGTSLAKPFEAASREDWDNDFNVKFWGAIEFIRAVIPEMRKTGTGRIINVTSIAGRTPTPNSLPTSVARAAGIALTKALSKDLAADNILVNTVCIGFIKSGQHERRYTRQNAGTDFNQLYAEEAKRRGIPIGRAGEASEAADVIAFLASARASYLTGVAINIDGGTSPVV